MTGESQLFDAEFLAQYEILDEVSAGGMGVVYRARQRSLDREVAIKFPLLADAELLARFGAEAKILASLAHPGIVQVFAWGSIQNRPFLVEELIEGESLRVRMSEHGKFSLTDAFKIGREIADALGYVHSRGVVHRDLKPSNVLLGRDRAKLIDFGIAREVGGQRRTQAGVILGTPEYLAPEAVEGQPLGPPADIYAFGTLLFEMLTGELPLPAGDLVSMVRRRSQEEAPRVTAIRPGVSPVIADLIAATLDRSPESRPAVALVLQTLTDELSDLLGATLGTSEPSWVSEVKPSSASMSGPKSVSSASATRAKLQASAVTSYSAVRPARSPSGVRPQPTSRLPSSVVAAAGIRKLHPGLLVLGAVLLATIGLLLGLFVGSRMPGRTAAPSPASLAEKPPPEVPPVDSRAIALERLAREAEEAPSESSRLSAYYRLKLAARSAGDAGIVLPAGRLDQLRTSLIREDDRAGSLLQKLLESGPPEAPLELRRLAAVDAVSMHGRKTAAAATTWLAQIDPKARGTDLARRLRDDLVKTPSGLKAATRELLQSPGGRLWEAIQPEVPVLLADSRVGLDVRRKLASILCTTRGFALLHERYKLVSPIDPAVALAGIVTVSAKGEGAALPRTAPVAEFLRRAGLEGPGADLLMNKKGEEDYVYRDAGPWYFAAIGTDANVQNLKEQETIPSVRLPPAGSPPGAGVVFVAKVIDLDPEDSVSLLVTPVSPADAPGLELIATRPDVAGAIDDTMLVTVKVSPSLLPPGDYSVKVEARRLLMQRRFLDSATRMRARLQRLAVAAVPAR